MRFGDRDGYRGITSFVSSPRVEDDQPLRRAGHGDIAVDGALDAVAEGIGIEQDDQVELEPLGERGERCRTRDGSRRSTAVPPMTQAVPSA